MLTGGRPVPLSVYEKKITRVCICVFALGAFACSYPQRHSPSNRWLGPIPCLQTVKPNSEPLKQKYQLREFMLKQILVWTESLDLTSALLQ